MENRKIAVLFPGIGYHKDKPLLYYAGKIAKAYGCEVRSVEYGKLPEHAKGDPVKAKECFRIACAAAREQLSDVHWEDYSEVFFIAKSLGTVAAADYTSEFVPRARCILYTPIDRTFDHIPADSIVFTGTKDPLADWKQVQNACESRGIVCYVTEDANHSLETGDILLDLTNLKAAMYRTESFIAHRGRFAEDRV